MKFIPAIIVFLIGALFTYFAFFEPVPCDIDQIGIWCNLHPMSVYDLVGIPMFYGGLLLLIVASLMDGLPNWLTYTLFVDLVLSVILIHV